MKEREEVKALAGKNELRCTEYRHEVSEGILITREITKFHLRSVPDDAAESGRRAPTVILFDSLDGRVHDEPKMIRDLNYFEYAEVWLDGRAVLSGARTAKTERRAHAPRAADPSMAAAGDVYDVGIVRYRDHLVFDIDDGRQTTRVTLALPDSTRYAYIALTGERCHLMDVSVAKAEGEIDENYIERIAPEISYIDRIEGDIPNVQVDGFRSAASRGIPITDGLEIRFHTMSLPTARLVWHCPYFSIYTSEDGRVNGPKFREYALVRLDGENWEAEDDIVNELTVNRQADFVGWDAWKENNKKGYDCAVVFERKGNRITLVTENFGIYIRNTTYAEEGKKVYVALTGDQCALTDIRIRAH